MNEIVERLRQEAESTAKASQHLADAKSSRNQAAGDADACYMGLTKEQTISWKAADHIDHLSARNRELEAENTRLRAALAQSDQPCAYCSLPAKEWNKCQHGFPGCNRADDALGCPELGAALRNQELEDRALALTDLVKWLLPKVSRSVGSYSMVDLNVLFAEAREKIMALSFSYLEAEIRQRIEREAWCAGRDAAAKVAEEMPKTQHPAVDEDDEPTCFWLSATKHEIASAIRALLPPDQATEENITEGCGCSFCDAGLLPTKTPEGPMHLSQPCTRQATQETGDGRK